MPSNLRSESRNFTQAKGTIYFLPHDEEQRDRLILQHNIFLRTYDSQVLHVPVELRDDDWVLDAGCGTGVWLQDLAREAIANPFYVGIDIESALMPDPVTLPPKMTFETHSITNLPAQWTGKFTVVHQRLLMSAHREQEWEQAINELYRVLKPGGWIQLLEMKVWTSGPALARQLELMYQHSDATGTMWRDITQRLPDFLRRSGFINIREDVRRTPLGAWAGQDGIDGSANLRRLMEGFKAFVLAGGGYGVVNNELEYDELTEQVLEELDHTPGSGTNWSMFLAQKPLSVS